MKKRQKEIERVYEEQWAGGKGSHHPDYDPDATGDDVVKASRETEVRRRGGRGRRRGWLLGPSACCCCLLRPRQRLWHSPRAALATCTPGHRPAS